MNKQPNQPDPTEKLVGKGIDKVGDKVVAAAMGGWWSRADADQKTAVRLLVAAVALGPLGLGFLGATKALFAGSGMPGWTQVRGVFWLFVITLPVVLGVVTVVLVWARMPAYPALILSGGLVYAGAVSMATMNIPTNLGDLYCYAVGPFLYGRRSRHLDDDRRGRRRLLRRLSHPPRDGGTGVMSGANYSR